VKTPVNRPDFFEKLGFQDKIFIKETIIFIPSKVLGDFKANKIVVAKVRNSQLMNDLLLDHQLQKVSITTIHW